MGFNSVQVQGNFDLPENTLMSCVAEGLLETGYPILLSIPSFYAVSWAQEFISKVRKIKPFQPIIVGGRWVIGDHPERLSKLLGDVDLVVPGIGETVLPKIISQFVRLSPNHTSIDTLPTPLNYALLKDRKLYQPSIEVSRGCGMGCSFCQERDEKLLTLKSPANVVSELRSTILSDELRPMTPYFEASVFAPNKKWAEELRNLLIDSGISVGWRAEARADSSLLDFIEILSEGGLKVIDLGLESANPEQLTRMKKTKDPVRYLSRASELLKRAHALGVSTKVNVLLFAGETISSIAQTTEWLEEHRPFISGVSVGPVMCFGWQETVASYIDELSVFGASLVTEQPILGVGRLNLSREIDYDHSMDLSKSISQSFMSAEQYFDLKAFSYFPRSYLFEDFYFDIKEQPSNFSLSLS